MSAGQEELKKVTALLLGGIRKVLTRVMPKLRQRWHIFMKTDWEPRKIIVRLSFCIEKLLYKEMLEHKETCLNVMNWGMAFQKT